MRHARPAAFGRTPRRLLAALVGLALVAVPQTVSAQWLQAGAGPATVQAAGLPAGARPTTTKSGLTVTVTWNPTVVSGAGATGYIVRRYTGAGAASTMTGGTCGGSTVNTVPNVVAATSCTDTRGLFDGSNFVYRVQPVLQRWTGVLSDASTPAT